MDKQSLLKWFFSHQRSFPWRDNRDPYRVWISETMLQQTRASVVVSYFERWMEIFPNVQALAVADFQEVLKAWEGLGYYSRARNLHLASRQIVEEYGGQVPSNLEDLRSIKGIGPYTACAILAFAYQKNEIALDGNVKRVFSRFFGIEDDLTKKKGKASLEASIEKVVKENFSWELSEALIELGAVQCTPSPKCELCPLSFGCQAYEKGLQASIPFKKKKTSIQRIKRAVLIFENEGFLPLQKNPQGKIMADLHEFPYFELEKNPSGEQILSWCKKNVDMEFDHIEVLDSVYHTFTSFRVELFPFFLRCKTRFTSKEWQWYTLKQIKKLTFSSGHRRILKHLINEVLCESCT